MSHIGYTPKRGEDGRTILGYTGEPRKREQPAYKPKAHDRVRFTWPGRRSDCVGRVVDPGVIKATVLWDGSSKEVECPWEWLAPEFDAPEYIEEPEAEAAPEVQVSLEVLREPKCRESRSDPAPRPKRTTIPPLRLSRFVASDRFCKQCNAKLERKKFPGGQMECPSVFLKRELCSAACAAEAQRVAGQSKFTLKPCKGCGVILQRKRHEGKARKLEQLRAYEARKFCDACLPKHRSQVAWNKTPPERAAAILDALRSGMKHAEVAAKYQISLLTIAKIKRTAGSQQAKGVAA